MFRVALLACCLTLCQGYAVLPLVVPAAHSLHGTQVAPYGLHGYGGYGFYGHGLLAKPLGHHILKRSPHLVAPLGHGVLGHGGLGHVAPLAAIAPVAPVVAPIAHVAPVAVSHQSRVDVRTSPAVVSTAVLPVIKPVVPLITPVIHAAPLLHKPLIGAHLGGHLGGHGYASVYPHLGHY